MSQKNWLFRVRDNWLDWITPIQVWWIGYFYPRTWAYLRSKEIIRKERPKKSENFLEVLKVKWLAWMHPDRWKIGLLTTLVIIALPQLLLALVLNDYSLPRLGIWENSSEGQSTLIAVWQVLAALIGITFVIVVFLTQYAMDRQYERRAFPLFASNTWMIFCVMMGLLTLLSMGVNVLLWGNAIDQSRSRGGIIIEFLEYTTLYHFILFAVNILLTIRLYVVTYMFLSPTHFRQIFRENLQVAVKEGVFRELRRRIARNLVQEIYKQEGIERGFLDHYPNKILVSINNLTTQIREVVDVNLRLLEIAIQRARIIESGQPNPSIIFLGDIGHRVSAERPQIACVSPMINQPRVIRLLQNAVRLAPIPDRRKSNVSDELLLNRDLMAIAIRSGNADEVENLLSGYVDTLNSFLRAFSSVGLSYTFEMAYKDSGFFEDWPFISEILEQFIGLIDLAFGSDDPEVVRHFTYFPLNVMGLAFQERDHLLFRRFSNLYYVLYVRGPRHIQESSLRQSIVNQCSSILKDFDHYRIAHAVENAANHDQEVSNLTDYSVQILLVLNRIAKAAIDQRDWDQYHRATGFMRQIYKNVDEKYDEDYLELLSYQSDRGQGQALPDTFQAELVRAQSIVTEKYRLSNIRRVLMMGFGAWMIHLFETNRIQATELFDLLYPAQAEFLEASILYETYSLQVTDHRIDDLTEWNSWELDEKPNVEGEVSASWLMFDQWIARYYTIRMLDLMPIGKDVSIPELKPLSNSKGTLDVVRGQISYLETTPIWQEYLHTREPSFEQRKNVLLEIHRAAAEKQRILEEIELVKQPLDSDKINAFIEEVKKAWLENSALRKLFVHYGNFILRPDVDPPEGLLAYGINELTDKGAFVNQTRIGYPDWGSSYGRGLAKGEEILIASDINSPTSDEISLEDLDEKLIQKLVELRSLGLNPVILCNRKMVFETLNKSKRFQYGWRVQDQELLRKIGAVGLYDEAFVIDIEAPDSSRLILVDIQAYAKLVQYRPTETEDFPLSISIETLSDEEAAEILLKNPDWAKDSKTGAMLDQEAAIRKIRQHVHLQIWQRFRLEDKNPNAVRIIKVAHHLSEPSPGEAT